MSHWCTVHWHWESSYKEPFSCTAQPFYYNLPVSNPRLLLTSALLERNLHTFLRWVEIHTSALTPIHPRPSSVISCDSELSPLQAGWLIDQFNQTYMWKLCKTFALSMPVRQLSWQEKSFFSCIIHLYLLFLALMYLWSAFLPPFLHKSLEGFCIDTKGKKSLCCSLKNTNARNARCTEHVLSFMKDINIFFWQWTLTPKDAQQGPRSDSAPGYCTPTWAEALPIKDINMH